MNINIGSPSHLLSSNSSSFSDNEYDDVQLMNDLEAIDAEQEAIIRMRANNNLLLIHYLNQQNNQTNSRVVARKLSFFSTQDHRTDASDAETEMNSTAHSKMSNKEGEVVCVTGGSGCIGSWLVRLLLDRRYTVHATVRNLNDEKETEHLKALEGADTRLRLFQIDLLDYDSIFDAINGCAGVFHLASPCIVDQVLDPEKELLDPAIKGTVNVLSAAKAVGVKRVVVTSSISAITPSPKWPADKVKAEDCWTDVEYCKFKELWYPLSKTLAEKAAWEFAKENGLNIVVVNPGTVMGPVNSAYTQC
ncbi:hypothetical protein Pint_32473 [Pistacia integerrima]|uniref:Uncharacterized protein n=1 Tax=Pistacia integerrima TaxID=434235 RepID=A0ACC0XRL2_9ROSI|nr:hypothetical protein Pint_32473 [Pistacia integerrima]